MQCPVCLLMLLTRDAVAQVNGSLLCAHHAAEAVLYSEPGPRRSPSQRAYSRPPDAPPA